MATTSDYDPVAAVFDHADKVLDAVQSRIETRKDAFATHYAAAAGEAVAAARGELREARALAAADEDGAAAFTSAVELTMTDRLLAGAAEALEAAGVDLAAVDGFLKSALGWIKTFLTKALEFMKDGPLKILVKDILVLFPQIEGFLNPPKDPIAGLTDDVAELEAKVERFLHQVVGNPLVKKPGTGAEVIPEVEGPPPEPTLQGSLLWFLWDIERKLEYLWNRIEGGGDFPRPDPDALITPLVDDPTNRGAPIGKEIDELRERIDCLTKLLGKTLYGAEWDCGATMPRLTPPPPGELHPVDPATGERPNGATPPESIKDEIHNLELQITILINIIINPPERPEEDPPFLVDLKRISVYEAEVFTPAAAGDARLVEVRAGAFDLAGWIDLTEMPAGATVRAALHVNLPGGARRLYRSRVFTGPGDAALHSLHDVAGPGILVGDAVDVEIALTGGGGGFPIPYQFVVESQRYSR